MLQNDQKKFGNRNNNYDDGHQMKQSYQEDYQPGRYRKERAGYNDNYSNDRRGFGGGYGGNNDRYSSCERDNEPKESATDRFINNAGR